MKRKTFADKLATGTAIEASDVAVWWPHHSCAVSAYLKAGREPGVRRPFSDSMITLARKWDARVEDPEELMMQHSGLEIALINAAVTADSEAIDKLQVALDENARAQVIMMATRIRSFPTGTFSALMRDHVRYLLEAVGHWMDGHPRKLAGCESKCRQNAVSLSTLLTEWI